MEHHLLHNVLALLELLMIKTQLIVQFVILIAKLALKFLQTALYVKEIEE